MKTLRYSINGELYKISCISYEPESEAGFAVVCLHGFGGDKESSAVRRLAEKINERGGAVVCFDFACHGESEADESMLTVENCVRDAKNVYAIAKNKYGRVSFFATSFGAFILINMLKGAEFKGIKAVLRSPAVKMESTFLKPICNLTSAELKSKEYVECGFERKMKLGYDFWLDLKNHNIDDAFFDNEVLMIYGDRDDVVSPCDMAEFARKRENIQVKIIKGADHGFKGKGQLEEAIDAAVDFLTK